MPKYKPRGSKASNKEYLAATILLSPYNEIQSPHYIGTLTLREGIYPNVLEVVYSNDIMGV